MQLYALDLESRPIFANHALKQTDYICFECRGVVRVRGGNHRQNHFYHLTSNNSCKLHGKSMTHLQVQLFLEKKLPAGDSLLECRFAEIDRIADVVWKSEKIVFEVQYSSITYEEVKQRNLDYNKLGYRVVWILHDQRYNQSRLTAAESFLRQWPHYYTNINAEGEGVIYDQFCLSKDGIRRYRLPPLPIKIEKLVQKDQFSPLKILEERRKWWKLSFEDDLASLDNSHSYLLEALQAEKSIEAEMPSKTPLWKWILKLYWAMFLMFLEKACR